MFSLEEEDYSGMFLTQSGRVEEAGGSQNEMRSKTSEDLLVFEDAEKDVTSSSNSSLEREGVESGQYSDISDPDDDFMNPVYGRGQR